MTGKEIIVHIEKWAPPGAAWKNDNVGLQVGSLQREITNVMLALELTAGVADEAVKKKCNFIITHHPFLFHPFKRIDLHKDKNSRLLEILIKNDITLYSAHTNLDFTKNGVSFRLAQVLGLKKIEFLKKQESNQYKVVTFVPANSLTKVSEALFSAGAGTIGEYTHCSFRLNGEGTFLGSENSNPAIGKKGSLETVIETRLEVLADSWNLEKVLSSLRKSHPYEEPAYDIYPLSNDNVNFGIGAIGELDSGLTEKEFLTYLSAKLKTDGLRYSRGKRGKIKRVAVCGGSGSELIHHCIKSGADAFITADIKYHSFHEAQDEILLIDAGHYETEIPVMDEMAKRLKNIVGEKSIKVYKYSGSTNPVIFFNN